MKFGMKAIVLAGSVMVSAMGTPLFAEQPDKTDAKAESKPGQTRSADDKKSLDQLREEYRDLQFGMFIHFGIAAYHEKEWATGEEPASSFNPTKLDCDQWADAAESAGMRYAVLTTKHVGGFALWDSAETDYDVASSPYGKDIVRQFVNAFRERDMEIGLYYSIWDGHHNISKGNITREKIEHVKAQLRELLTNYGKVDIMWLDGYQHEKRGRTFFPNTKEVPFDEIYALIKKLQPNCLVMRHPGMAMYDTDYSDVQVWEGIFTHPPTRKCWERFQKEHPNEVQEVCDILQRGWFWKKAMPKQPLLSAANVVDKLEVCQKHNCNYLLNAAVNRKGLLDQNVVDRFKEIGKAVRKSGVLKRR